MTKLANAIPWPDLLAWIAKGLTESTFQNYSEFKPDKGPPLRHAQSTPVPLLIGTFTFDDKNWAELQKLLKQSRYNVYSIALPHLGRTASVLFRREPVVKMEKSQLGGPKTRIVELQLVEKK